MIAAELAQRRFVQLEKDLAQCFGFGMPGSKALSVNLAQRADARVSVFVADFTVVVAVAIVETCAAHGALHCAYSGRASSHRDQMAILRCNRAMPAAFIVAVVQARDLSSQFLGSVTPPLSGVRKRLLNVLFTVVGVTGRIGLAS